MRSEIDSKFEATELMIIPQDDGEYHPREVAQAVLASNENTLAHKTDSDAKFSNAPSDVDTKRPTQAQVTILDNEKIINMDSSDPENKRQISGLHRSILLLIFCLAQFLDTFNVTELYTALPTVSAQLNMNGGESIWLISAYQLSLASCLLIGGRISDVYRPAPVFIFGAAAFSALSIAAGFIREKIALIVLRAILGLCAALTIPPAQALIIYFFPEPKAQAAALGAFGGCGTIGTVLGLVIGALLTEYASWPWAIWLIAFAAAPVAIGAFLLIPPGVSSSTFSKELKGWEKLKKIDIGGMAILISALILFTFSMTSGSSVGWKTAQTLVTLFVSFVLFAIFFVWEAKIPEDSAAVPPKVWSYPNIIILAAINLIPYSTANLTFTVFTNYWQNVFGWSAISTAVHFLPFVITAIFAIILTLVFLHRVLLSKWLPSIGFAILTASSILLIFADSPDRYWPIMFPAFLIACIGFTLVYLHVNIAKFHVTPPSISGTIAAIFYCTGQLGSSVGVTIVTSIVVNVDDTRPAGPSESWTDKYAGGAAAYGFYTAVTTVAAICFLFFSRDLQGTEKAKEERKVTKTL